MSECKRGTQPWQSHPRRMLRHKATIQCARLAFGSGGIYEQDEAERIVESRVIDVAPARKPDPTAVQCYPQEQRPGERRVGNEWVTTWNARWTPSSHKTKKQIKEA